MVDDQNSMFKLLKKQLYENLLTRLPDWAAECRVCNQGKGICQNAMLPVFGNGTDLDLARRLAQVKHPAFGRLADINFLLKNN